MPAYHCQTWELWTYDIQIDKAVFNQPLEKWNVSNVTDMVGMFMDATSFSHYPKSWVVPKGQSDNMFIGTKVEKVAKKKPLKTEERYDPDDPD